MRPSRADQPTICLVCDADGVVRLQSGPSASVATPAIVAVQGGPTNGHHDDDPSPVASDDDGWDSGPSPASRSVRGDVGTPLVKTYWFDHLDCDQRELQQAVRRCARDAAPSRLRVWLRIDEHQLIRAELTLTPLAGGSGAPVNVLVRAEPTPAAPPGRRGSSGLDADEEVGPRPVRTSATVALDPPDLLDARLPTALLRLDRARGTLLAANAAFADLVRRPRDAVREPAAHRVVRARRSPRDRRVSRGPSVDDGGAAGPQR